MGLAEDLATWLADILSPFPGWLIVALASMLPVAELRGSIPLGLLVLNMGIVVTLVVAVVANILILPLLWAVLPYVERWLRRSPRIGRTLDRIYQRTRRRATKRVENGEELAVFFIVAAPLPGMGAWTGALVAYLFDLPYRKSLLVGGLGSLAGGLLVTLAVEAGIGIFGL